MRSIALFVLIGMALVDELVSAQSPDSDEWIQYKQQHGKVYADEAENAMRFNLFLASKQRIARHNADPTQTYKLGLNHMSDWTAEELQKIYGNRSE